MAYLVNNIKVTGKIGVYGRSIGGIAACHLAQKYQDLVQTLIIDRSFHELSAVPANRMKGMWSNLIFDTLTCMWRTFNHTNYLNTTNCYKIITCDP